MMNQTGAARVGNGSMNMSFNDFGVEIRDNKASDLIIMVRGDSHFDHIFDEMKKKQ
jgi:hypothetical protein